MVRIRSAGRDDSPSLGEVIVAATRSAFEGRVPEECLLELPVAESVANWKRFFDSGSLAAATEVLFVAENAKHQVVGCILAGRRTVDVIHDVAIATRYPREITVLNVAPGWHKRGIGRSLVRAAADWFIERGERAIAVRALEPNPNRPFYERLGARALGFQPFDWAGFATREVIYGWDDVGLVASAA